MAKRKYIIFSALIIAKILISITLAIFFGFISFADEADAATVQSNQVKVKGSATVYYIDYAKGVKKAYVNAKSFLSYGNKWNSIKTISQNKLDQWSDLHLVKVKNSPAVYYIDNGQKTLIKSEAEFKNLGYKWSDIVVISQTDLDQYKNNLNLVAAANYGNPDKSDGTILIDTIDTNSQNYIPSNSRSNTLAIFDFTAKGNKAEIKGITLTKGGVIGDASIDSIYLTDENGNLLTEKYQLNNRQVFFNLSGQPITIASGQTQRIYVKADINKQASSNQTLSVRIANEEDVNASASLSADFPLASEEFKIVDGSQNLGDLAITFKNVTTNTRTVSIGTKKQTIASFNVKENSKNENIIIKKITISATGTVYDSDLSNFILMDDSGNTLGTSAMLNRKVVFTINNYKIRKNHEINFLVKADVISGDGRDFKFYIESSQDIEAAGLESGYSTSATLDKGTDSENYNRFEINRTAVFLSVSSDENLKIYRDQENAIISNYELRNNLGDIRLNSMSVELVASNGAPALDTPIIIYDKKSGDEIASIDPKKVTNKTAQVNLSNYSVQSGKTTNLLFKTNIPDTAETQNSYQLNIKSLSYYIGDSNILYTDNYILSGQSAQVIKPGIYVAAGTFEKDDLAVAGKEKVKLGTFHLEASGEKVKITSVTISSVSGFGNMTYMNGFANLALYKNNSRVSDIIVKPNENSYTFTGLKITIDEGKSIELNLKADSSSNTTGSYKFMLENVVAQGDGSKASVSVSNQKIESEAVTFSQSLVEISALNGGSISKKTEKNVMGTFTFTNKSNEIMKLKNITVVTTDCTGNISSVNGYKNLRFGTSAGKDVSSKATPVADSNKISFNYSLGVGETLTANLYIDTKDTASLCAMKVYLRGLQAEGRTSHVVATIKGDPTLAMAVATSSSNNNTDDDDNAPQTVKDDFIKPVSGRITYGFHDSDYPYKNISEHEGIDIEASQGTKVKASAAGYVSSIVDGGASGCTYIVLQHRNNITTLYAHLSKVSVKLGQAVEQGEEIGLSGGTPGTYGAGAYTTGPHLHFELMVNGTNVDPEKYLK